MGEHSKGGRGSGGQSRPYRGGHTGKGGAHGAGGKGCAILALALAAVPVGILAAAAMLAHWALS